MAIKVYKDDLDWMFACAEHGETGFAARWEWALEMAYGHAAMFHPCSNQKLSIAIKDALEITEKIVTIANRIK